nr:calcium-binding protein [Sulfitobacter algicola]
MQSDANDLVISLTNGDQVTLLDQLIGDGRHGVESIQFSDGAV